MRVEASSINVQDIYQPQQFNLSDTPTHLTNTNSTSLPKYYIQIMVTLKSTFAQPESSLFENRNMIEKIIDSCTFQSSEYRAH